MIRYSAGVACTALLALTSLLASAAPTHKVKAPAKASGAHPSVAPEPKDTGSYQLVFHRPSREGFRSERKGTVRIANLESGAAQGLKAGDFDDYLDLTYDVVEKVSKVDPRGRALEIHSYFKSLKMRVEPTGDIDDAQCEATALTIVRWPTLEISRDDGEDINSDELEILKHIYGKQDPDEPTDDDLIGPGHAVSVGETWQPSAATISKILQSKGLIIPDNGVTLTLKATAHKKVNNVDCIIVDLTMICPNVDGDSSLPDDIRSIHGHYEHDMEWALPVDTEAPQEFSKLTTKSTYNAVLNKDDLTVQVVQNRATVTTETFVKEL